MSTYEVLVLGSGPGGYTAAFRAADLGMKVVMVERHEALGGVCLNVGCIPSKAMLHFAQLLDETKALAKEGIPFKPPRLSSQALVDLKNQPIKKLTVGLAMLAKQRGVTVIKGEGKFASPNTLAVTSDSGTQTIEFQQAVIAAGSEAIHLPFIPEDPRIFSSTGALEFKDIKGSLCVLGGGIIGLEMATVYASLGVSVTVIEFMPQLIPAADADLVNVLKKQMEKKGVTFLMETKVTAVEAKKSCLTVTVEGKHGQDKPLEFQQMLVAVGRRPNGSKVGAELAGIKVDETGFIPVDNQQRTNVSHIFAIGDIVGQPMLAHKAIPEGKIAAEVIAGKNHVFDPKTIPNVAYTDPELAWTGLTEQEAKAKGIDYELGSFPWMASGRSLSMGRDEGITKALFDPKTHRLLGCGMVGPHAGDLIAEATLAIEMAADAEDVALTIHPHPTLSETFAQACEMYEGSITDLLPPKKKKASA